ncbi:Nucleoside triphosphate pyrophosphohydrolase,nucleoside triphosphate pyrophosphohydrolase,MazG family protein,MazG nucleotide pyrophosphohydrolase domain [Chlamydia serpentis]|uniref:Nucleoside triphosphate pyrophosphohydrolase,nucleoside triphosphate pyrophosphohydrolase,MazG family protein,MazG nucleotide pyrophosphohydrolase domain n=1 Tax=Chlamydia serpentis TaxID=1967782 RepID=A0A2R8FB62_9CHLA|nr:MazG nucleotide pyrophosphohydrolase domain-containing protein [Chlamydia serpentis]SPN73536.1 Nucleoside triphosphate pyrophosphohydrolase,nucleoside triphosphate pyrophosphohydrolase,MazG family protein,MazG nucleotide pyrophosphohydrolase domain [Chlamydia serpentis]
MKSHAFSQLISIIHSMVIEGRCPWSREQSLLSIVEHILQECQEFHEAVLQGKTAKDIGSEAGDIITLSIILCFLLEREELLAFGDVANGAIEKLRRRAPYLFSKSNEPVSLEEADRLWELAKHLEKNE